MRALLLCLALALPCAADIVYLKNGGKLEGKTTDQGDTVDLQTKSGAVMHLKKADIDHIEAKPFEVEAPKPPTPAPAKGDASLGEMFEDPIRGYRISFPKGWRRAQNDKGITWAGAKEDGFVPHIDITPIKINVALEELVSKLKESLDHFKVESEGERKLAGAEGKRAWEILGSFPHPKQADLALMCVQTVVATEKENYYLIMATCSKASFAKHAEQFKAAIDSFTLTQAVDLTDAQQAELSRSLAKAREAMAAGKDQQAIDAYRKVAELLPTYVDVHHNLAVLYLKTKQTDKAIQEYQIVTSLRPGNADDLCALGTLLSQAHKFEDAAKALRSAVEIDPNHGDAWNNLGTVLLAKGDTPGAIEALKRAAELEPQDASPEYNLGQAYEAAGKPDLAKEAYKKALVRDPKHEGARKALEKMDAQK